MRYQEHLRTYQYSQFGGVMEQNFVFQECWSLFDSVDFGVESGGDEMGVVSVVFKVEYQKQKNARLLEHITNQIREFAAATRSHPVADQYRKTGPVIIGESSNIDAVRTDREKPIHVDFHLAINVRVQPGMHHLIGTTSVRIAIMRLLAQTALDTHLCLTRPQGVVEWEFKHHEVVWVIEPGPAVGMELNPSHGEKVYGGSRCEQVALHEVLADRARVGGEEGVCLCLTPGGVDWDKSRKSGTNGAHFKSFKAIAETIEHPHH
ncbi:hypothetical protein DFH08DRAFT_820661 [Mycena albidolilacea]|uniref:Uncharacterized protein n=1 Tax=Mycena albidolilacea TaxID=1033008 RepID=A0AAD7EDX9_9AGAR|nr:hypothetical protein DFH08DRAFT_820661 [Mycena albidolilacea]